MKRTYPEARDVKIALYRRGLTLHGWSLANGYAHQTVAKVINRHAGGHAREPWGQITRAILRDLSKTIGREIIPGILSHEEDAA